MSKQKSSECELMKSINCPKSVLFFIGSIADSTFPNRYSLNCADDDSCDPTCKYHKQKITRMHIRKQGIRWVVDGIKFIINALILLLNLSK